VFAGYCRTILDVAEESREALSELQQDVSGELALHVHDALVRGWFAPQMEAFLALHPDIRLTLHTRAEVPAPQQKDLLCVWLGPLPEEPGLRQEVLGRLTRGLYAQPEYLKRHGVPRHPRDLARHRWVDLLADGLDGLTLQHAQHGSVKMPLPPSRMRVDRLVLQGDALAAGHGLGILPHWLAEQRLQHHPGTLVPCLPDWQAAPLAVRLLSPHGPLPRRMRAFIEFIRTRVPGSWGGPGSGRRVPMPEEFAPRAAAVAPHIDIETHLQT
jgi:DNA-binding transcriptional LysR family regulator